MNDAGTDDDHLAELGVDGRFVGVGLGVIGFVPGVVVPPGHKADLLLPELPAAVVELVEMGMPGDGLHIQEQDLMSRGHGGLFLLVMQ
jgi:hypothetical protein